MLLVQDVKGVMCPYCRQAIEKYSDVKPARRAMKKPVPSSHHLKATRFHLKVDKGCPKGKPRIPALYGWNGICSIGGLNDYAPPPNVTGADGPGLKPNRSEEGLLDNFQGFPLKPTDNLLAMSESVSVRLYLRDESSTSRAFCIHERGVHVWKAVPQTHVSLWAILEAPLLSASSFLVCLSGLEADPLQPLEVVGQEPEEASPPAA